MAHGNGNAHNFGAPSPAARSAAARKAAATRAANRANGTTSAPSSASKAPRAFHANGRRAAFASPVVTSTSIFLEALAKLEDALVAKASEKGLTDELRKQFEKYQKLKALALGPATNSATQNEALVAMKMSLIAALNLVF